MKKESLSLITVKTLLAVVIFTGIGTIIIGGGYLIGDYYKGGVDNRTVKPVDWDKWIIYEWIICDEDSDCYEYNPCGMGISCFNKTGYEISLRNHTDISCPQVEIMPWQSYRYNKEKCACSKGNCVKIFSKEKYCKALENSFKWCGENKPSKYPYSPEDSECLEIKDLFNENCVSEKNIENNISDWKTYRNEKFGFEVKYPENAVIVLEETDKIKIGIPTLNAEIYEDYLLISIKKSASNNCSNPLSTIIKKTETVILNDIEFVKEIGVEGAAGLFYRSISYSVLRNNNCLSLSFVVSAKFIDTSVRETNISQEEKIFNQILSTFKFIEN
jgi:hypothetical protein